MLQLIFTLRKSKACWSVAQLSQERMATRSHTLFICAHAWGQLLVIHCSPLLQLRKGLWLFHSSLAPLPEAGGDGREGGAKVSKFYSSLATPVKDRDRGWEAPPSPASPAVHGVRTEAGVASLPCSLITVRIHVCYTQCCLGTNAGKLTCFWTPLSGWTLMMREAVRPLYWIVLINVPAWSTLKGSDQRQLPQPSIQMCNSWKEKQ